MIGEAMACGVPCVVTDVGDCARIVAGTGIVVSSDDPEALMRGMEKMLSSVRRRRDDIAEVCRSRVVENFSEQVLVENSARVLGNLAS